MSDTATQSKSLDILPANIVGRGGATVTSYPSGWTKSDDGYSATGDSPLGTTDYVTVKATPLARCGWSFDHWVIRTYPHYGTAYDETTSTEQETTIAVPGDDVEGWGPFVQAWPVFTFSGTGLVMRDASDGSKILRGSSSGAKILIDN